MPATLGYHIVISGYGLWLPGDDRGSWSAAWDDEIGLVQPHTLHAGDPVRLRMSQERINGAPIRLTGEMIGVVQHTLAHCAAQSDWNVVAASIEPTHTHLLLTYTSQSIDNTIKWIKDQTTKAVHQDTPHRGPVWCKGKWRSFIFDVDALERAMRYIQQHNVRRGLDPRPYAFLTPFQPRP
jgi:REP element-mobilizing transposase RayT